MSSPTQRTLALLRKHGCRAQVVEKWIPQARRRVDLFGCIDIVAMRQIGTIGYFIIIGIQATSGDGGNASARLKKAQNECGPALREWVSAGAEFYVISWAKRGAAGKVKRWTPRIVNHRGEVVTEAVFGVAEQENHG